MLINIHDQKGGIYMQLFNEELEGFLNVDLYWNVCKKFSCLDNKFPFIPEKPYSEGYQEVSLDQIKQLLRHCEGSICNKRALALGAVNSEYACNTFFSEVLTQICSEFDVLLAVAMYQYLKYADFISDVVKEENLAVLKESMTFSDKTCLTEIVSVMNVLDTKNALSEIEYLLKVFFVQYRKQPVRVTEISAIFITLNKFSTICLDPKISIYKSLEKVMHGKVGKSSAQIRQLKQCGFELIDCLALALTNKVAGTYLKREHEIQGQFMQQAFQSVEAWGIGIQTLLKHSKGAIGNACIVNDENFFWLYSTFGLSKLSVNLPEDFTRIANLKEEDFCIALSKSVRHNTDTGMLSSFILKFSNKIDCLFTIYREERQYLFTILKHLNLLDEVFVANEYNASIHSGLSTKESFDYLLKTVAEQGITCKSVAILLTECYEPDLNFLREEEKNLLFEIMEDFYFLVDSNLYTYFLQENQEFIEQLQDTALKQKIELRKQCIETLDDLEWDYRLIGIFTLERIMDNIAHLQYINHEKLTSIPFFMQVYVVLHQDCSAELDEVKGLSYRLCEAICSAMTFNGDVDLTFNLPAVLEDLRSPRNSQSTFPLEFRAYAVSKFGAESVPVMEKMYTLVNDKRCFDFIWLKDTSWFMNVEITFQELVALSPEELNFLELTSGFLGIQKNVSKELIQTLSSIRKKFSVDECELFFLLIQMIGFNEVIITALLQDDVVDCTTYVKNISNVSDVSILNDEWSEAQYFLLSYAIIKEKRQFLQLIQENKEEFKSMEADNILFDFDFITNSFDLDLMEELLDFYDFCTDEVYWDKNYNYTFEEAVILLPLSSAFWEVYLIIGDLKFIQTLADNVDLIKDWNVLKYYLQRGGLDRFRSFPDMTNEKIIKMLSYRYDWNSVSSKFCETVIAHNFKNSIEEDASAAIKHYFEAVFTMEYILQNWEVMLETCMLKSVQSVFNRSRTYNSVSRLNYVQDLLINSYFTNAYHQVIAEYFPVPDSINRLMSEEQMLSWFSIAKKDIGLVSTLFENHFEFSYRYPGIQLSLFDQVKHVLSFEDKLFLAHLVVDDNERICIIITFITDINFSLLQYLKGLAFDINARILFSSNTLCLQENTKVLSHIFVEDTQLGLQWIPWCTKMPVSTHKQWIEEEFYDLEDYSSVNEECYTTK